MTNKKQKTKRRIKFSSIVTVIMTIALVAAITLGILMILREPDEGLNLENNSDLNTAPFYSEENNKNDDTNESYDEKEAYEAANNPTEVKRDDDGKKIAEVYLVVNQNDELLILSGRVTNFVEEGGTCTYILSSGSDEKVYEKSVLPDPKITYCEAVSIKKKELSGNNWSVKVKYQSNDAEGESEKQNISIQ